MVLDVAGSIPVSRPKIFKGFAGDGGALSVGGGRSRHRVTLGVPLRARGMIVARGRGTTRARPSKSCAIPVRCATLRLVR